MCSHVFEGHPSIYNRFVLKGRVPVTIKYPCHTGVYPWVVIPAFPIFKQQQNAPDCELYRACCSSLACNEIIERKRSFQQTAIMGWR